MFTAKVDIRLINLVKANPVLYDYNEAKYMDFNTREVAWQKIGDELEKPGEYQYFSNISKYNYVVSYNIIVKIKDFVVSLSFSLIRLRTRYDILFLI